MSHTRLSATVRVATVTTPPRTSTPGPRSCRSTGYPSGGGGNRTRGDPAAAACSSLGPGGVTARRQGTGSG